MQSLKSTCLALMIGASGTSGFDNIGTAAGPKAQPVSGQSIADSSLDGWLITRDQEGAIIALSLPSGELHTVRNPGPRNAGGYRGSVRALSAPDQQGRIAFMLGRMEEKTWDLCMVNLDGTQERVLFTRPGDLIWDKGFNRKTAMGEQISLSPDGAGIAMIKGLVGVQMPGALLQRGEVEIWDINQGSSRTLGAAIDDGIEFFPDSQSLAIVDWVTPAQAAAQMSDADGFGKFFRKWSKIPAVFVLNTRTGERRFLHVGARPLVSTDGERIALSDFPGDDGVWRRRVVRVSDGFAQPVAVDHYMFVALLPGDTAIWLGPPGKADPTGQTKYFSPLRGPHDLVVARYGALDGSGAQTVMSGLDARSRVTFGPKAPDRPTPP